MARVKQTVIQRSFSFMETREDLLEADDAEIRQRSLRAALNMRGLATGVIQSRPGMQYLDTTPRARQAVEIRPASGLTYGLLVFDDKLRVVDAAAEVVAEIGSVPWSDGVRVWVEPFRKVTVIGGDFGIYTLEYSAGSWLFGRFAFSEAPGGELAQPYWVHEKGVSVQPSAVTGDITLTASAGIWQAGHVGLRLRYHRREMIVTERVSATVLRATVVNELPPSFNITVEDASEFKVNEAVIGADTNFQGIVTAIAGNVLSVATLEFFEGPDVNEELGGSTGKSKVTAKATVSPLPSFVWDEPLMSDLRGWPRAAATVGGRLVLLDFEAVPDALALSSARNIDDFDVGDRDDDAIVRQAGDNAPRWLHAVNMADLLLLADNGIYYVPMRENGVLSPQTFNPVFVDNTGCSEIKPVRVEDGVIFVDAGGQNISAALLDGNIYLKWSVRSLTTYHSHLIKSPVSLCGPSLTTRSAEKYVFVINSDGTLAAISWQESIRSEQIGFAPWETDGDFVAVAPLFQGYWALVDRTVSGVVARQLERFDDGAMLDSSVIAHAESASDTLEMNGGTLEMNGAPLEALSPFLMHLAGKTVSVYQGGWDNGDYAVAGDGTVVGGIGISEAHEIGLNFECDVSPWPIELVQSPRIGTLEARVLGVTVAVQNTIRFKVRLNGRERQVGDYGIGDDLTAPPPMCDGVHRFTIFGNRDDPDIRYIKDRPGPFRILSMGQRVQG